MTIMTILGDDFEDLAEEFLDLAYAGSGSVQRTANFLVQSTAQRAKNKIRAPGRSGRLYFDGTHRASAPGEPPANWTGALAASIHYTKMTDSESSVADVSVDVHYAHLLEFGGFNDSGQYVEARPFIYPSFQEALIQGEKFFESDLRRVLG